VIYHTATPASIGHFAARVFAVTAETAEACPASGVGAGKAVLTELADTGSAEVVTAAVRPDSVSHFSRCKSVRISAADW
jgi:hypothetical protein